ncbi:protein SENESCENCE-ASSOCIATED GENE 21, mitochondrial-like [Tasmannia lanceolata]|uniref:protein SENESCENCE-ASSOCIATED GENE 21, mitochondrial-like n=1 Tax=Tasmannia lanceolata TaxID=3420 RepID=UPI0040649BE6
MARFLSNPNLLASIVESLALSVTRRGVSTASQGAVSNMARGGSSRGGGAIIKGEEKSIIKGGEASWVPDPKTGFYRPMNSATEVDVADLREALLSHKTRHH